MGGPWVDDRAMRTGDVVWLALAGLLVVLAFLGALFPSRVASVPDCLRALRRNWVMRCVVVAFWGWLGWHFFVR